METAGLVSGGMAEAATEAEVADTTVPAAGLRLVASMAAMLE